MTPMSTYSHPLTPLLGPDMSNCYIQPFTHHVNSRVILLTTLSCLKQPHQFGNWQIGKLFTKAKIERFNLKCFVFFLIYQPVAIAKKVGKSNSQDDHFCFVIDASQLAKLKRVFLSCYCHEIYRVEAVHW